MVVTTNCPTFVPFVDYHHPTNDVPTETTTQTLPCMCNIVPIPLLDFDNQCHHTAARFFLPVFNKTTLLDTSYKVTIIPKNMAAT